MSNVGYRLKGAKGAVLAAICYVVPALSLFLVFSILYVHYVQGSQAVSHLYGISAALGGVILANAYRIGKSHVTHPLMWLLVVAAAMAKLWLGLNTVLIVLLFGVVGLGLSYVKARGQKS